MRSSRAVTDDFLTRFGGIARLYGISALEKFYHSHVMIIGLGGVGSWVVEALARSGVGTFSLVDLDDVCQTNVNRHIHALTHTVGQSKTTALTERVRAINPEATLIEHHCFYGEENANAILTEKKPNLVIDAIDSSRSKIHLLATCRDLGIPVITSGAAGGKIDASKVQIDDLSRVHGDSLLNGVRRQLRGRYRFPQATKKGGKFGIPAVFSPEERLFAQCDGSTSTDRPENHTGGIRCDAGYGAATHLTATFGNLAAGWALQQLAE